MTVKDASAALRKGMLLGLSRPVLGLAEHMAGPPAKYRTVAAAAPKLNRKQRRACPE